VRTLHLCWPGVTGARGAEQVRAARRALGRLSPLVAGNARCVEVGIDGLAARNGDERAVAAAALRIAAAHLRALPLVAIASSRLVAAVVAEGAVAGAAAGAGPVIVPHGAEAATLAPLPVDRLLLAATDRPAEELAAAVERCTLLGVRTIGAVARLHVADLAARIGPIAEILVPLARGADVQAIAPVPLPRRLLAREGFDLPLGALEEFRFPLRRMLDALLARVQRDGAAVGVARLHLARERGAPLRAVARLPLPTADRTQIERLLLAALERAVAAASRTAPLDADGVVGAQLRFDDVLPATGEQLTLLGARSPRSDRLAWSTAAIAVRYGADRVLHGELLDPDDPRDERRVRFVRSHPEIES
jgi:hypothetical protein